MKNSQFLIILLLVWFALALKPNTANAADTPPDPVLDITAKPLRAGIPYYILPVIRGRGGGLTLSNSNSNKTRCPLDVVQDQYEVSPGLPLTFSPVTHQKGGVVPLSTDLNIKFSAATVCVQSTVWKLGGYDAGVKTWFVTTGGVEGNPGRSTTANWFKIEKDGEDYKLVFCPSVCSFCKVVCKDVGVYVDGGVRRVVLSDVPLRVMFRKAEKA